MDENHKIWGYVLMAVQNGKQGKISDGEPC